MLPTAYVYFVGTAGSGKSTLTRAFYEWCLRESYNAITVNLDPGVTKIPYTPDVDVREWISLDEIMDQYNLGPNGAQIVGADMIALNISELIERIHEFKTDYVLLDTPGQIELFTFRSAGKIITEQLGEKSTLVSFLLDPVLASSPSNYISQLMLSALTQFRLNIPLINVLPKSDIIDENILTQLKMWSKNSELLHNAIIQKKSLYDQLGEKLISVIKEMESYTDFITISSTTFEGIEDLYVSIQNIFFGGEDLEKG